MRTVALSRGAKSGGVTTKSSAHSRCSSSTSAASIADASRSLAFCQLGLPRAHFAPCGALAQSHHRRSFHVGADRALAFTVKVQLLVLLPPLEQAPDQTASRPLETRNVTEVPWGTRPFRCCPRSR